jgi:hypothetical protein
MTDILDIDFEEIRREAKEFADRVYGNYSKFCKALADDVNAAADLLRANDTQFTRRTYLRSCFALVDGMLFAHRTVVQAYTKDAAESPLPPKWTEAERMLLQEVEYELADNGTVKVRGQKFQPFLKYTRFIFNVPAKHHRKSNPVDYGGSGWQSFRAAYEIRNRITHPKSPDDLLISDGELVHIRAAVAWFVEAANCLMKPTP